MEEAAGVRYNPDGHVKPGCPAVIVYADDFVALCHSRQQAEAVQGKLSIWLKERGLSLNREKTRIGRVSDGFDFLSFNIRRYRTSQGSKALTRPSRDAMKKIRRRLADELRDMRGAPTAEVICKLNPVIRGQANYYRSGASKKSFQALDSYLWRQLYKWARRRHPKKGRRWVTARYFGQYCQHRRNRWVFGDRETGAYLHKYAWTKIVRHAPVPGRHSPYDPALAQFWADRRRKQKPPQLAPAWQKALRDQQGLCPLCRELLLFADRAPDSPGQWETWYAAVGKAMTRQAITDTSTSTSTSTSRTKHRLVHAYCARRHPDGERNGTEQQTART